MALTSSAAISLIVLYGSSPGLIPWACTPRNGLSVPSRSPRSLRFMG